MREPLEKDAETFADNCPRCGSSRLHWTLRRVRPVKGPSIRALAWSCLECDAAWLDPLALGMDTKVADVDDGDVETA
jgi:hypothetical protein